MDASEPQDPELRAARRWVLAMTALGLVAFAVGVRAAPPVVFVHAESAEDQSRGAKKAEPTPDAEQSGEAERPTMMPWLYLMKR